MFALLAPGKLEQRAHINAISALRRETQNVFWHVLTCTGKSHVCVSLVNSVGSCCCHCVPGRGRVYFRPRCTWRVTMCVCEGRDDDVTHTYIRWLHYRKKPSMHISGVFPRVFTTWDHRARVCALLGRPGMYNCRKERRELLLRLKGGAQ